MRLFCLFILLSSTLFAGSTNLVRNGSFEARNPNFVGTHKNINLRDLSQNWDIYDSIPGWKKGGGSGIEVWDRPTWSQPAQHGRRMVELDAHNSSSMYQRIYLNENTNYELSFWYRARLLQDAPNSFNNIEVSVGNQFGNLGLTYRDNGQTYNAFTVDNNPSNPHQGSHTEWKKYTLMVGGVASSGVYDLTFSDVSLSNSYGGLIDNVRMVAAVPEPSTVALLLVGFGMMTMLQNRNSKSREKLA